MCKFVSFQQTLFLRLGIVGELAPTTVEAAERMDLKQGGVGVVKGDKTGGDHTWVQINIPDSKFFITIVNIISFYIVTNMLTNSNGKWVHALCY